MGDLADTVNEAVERTRGAGGERFSLNTIVAISAAITATFIAVCNVKDGNICQSMQQAQAGAIDTWADYQAKGTKLNIAESALDGLRLQQKLPHPATPETRALVEKTIAEYEQKIGHSRARRPSSRRPRRASRSSTTASTSTTISSTWPRRRPRSRSRSSP